MTDALRDRVGHTPGPWAFDQDSGEVYFDDRDVCPVVAFVNGEGTSAEQAAADGFLIAASPCLLEAAEAAFEFLGGVDDAAEIRGQLLDAIRKATGAA